jgi:hypothetical protein
MLILPGQTLNMGGMVLDIKPVHFCCQDLKNVQVQEKHTLNDT